MPMRNARETKRMIKDMSVSMNPVANIVQAAKESWLGKQVGSLMGGGNKPVSAFKKERNAFSVPRQPFKKERNTFSVPRKPKRGGGGR